MTWCRDDPDGALLDVLVQPRASREQVGPLHGDRLKIAVQAPPVEGAANEAVIRLLARTLGVRRADVTVRAGATGRRKTVHVRGLAASDLQKKVHP